MLLKNMTAEQLEDIAKIAKQISSAKKNPNIKSAYHIEDIEPPANLQEFDENYIIELFAITENQAAEIKKLQKIVAEQQTLIDNLTKKSKTTIKGKATKPSVRLIRSRRRPSPDEVS